MQLVTVILIILLAETKLDSYIHSCLPFLTETMSTYIAKYWSILSHLYYTAVVDDITIICTHVTGPALLMFCELAISSSISTINHM